MPDTKISVIDCETTGLGRHDRIIELAIVTLDPRTGIVIDEFETLVNPGRDVGPTQLHGITASMVGLAPGFAEIAPAVASRLNNTVVAAHNLNFDRRMLDYEFERADVPVEWGRGICTLSLTGLKLAHAARALSIPLAEHHRAIQDARVSASILQEIGCPEEQTACRVGGAESRHACRTMRRDAFGMPLETPLRRWLDSACVPSSADACVEYFDLLDHVLSDLELDEDEAAELSRCQQRLELRRSEVQAMHLAYFQSLRIAALSDGIVTEQEWSMLHSVARCLGLPQDAIPAVSQSVAPKDLSIQPGSRVCFTGSAVGDDGQALNRSSLELLAASCGFQPVSAVTKSRCELLVASDPASQSGKARKARAYRIPIISVEDFLRLVHARA